MGCPCELNKEDVTVALGEALHSALLSGCLVHLLIAKGIIARSDLANVVEQMLHGVQQKRSCFAADDQEVIMYARARLYRLIDPLSDRAN